MGDNSSANLFSEETLKHVFIQRQSVLREDGIAKLLELFHDFVIQAGVVVVRPAQHYNPDAVFTFQLIEYLAGAFTDARLIIFQRLVAYFNRTVVLLL